MKISHNNHSYLSPSKLNSLTTLPVSVTSLITPTNTDTPYSATDSLILANANALNKFCDDETNDNIVSAAYMQESPTPATNNILTNSDDILADYRNDSLASPLLYHPPIDLNYETIATPVTPIEPSVASKFDLFTSNYAASMPIHTHVDDLLNLTATNTTTTSSTLESWNDDTNCEFARKEIAQTEFAHATRKRLFQTQNRFLSLSISPPLSRRQDMPVLRGTFVSL